MTQLQNCCYKIEEDISGCYKQKLLTTFQEWSLHAMMNGDPFQEISKKIFLLHVRNWTQ